MEALVVVAIIAMTSTLMIPNYQKYLKKSDQLSCDLIAYEVREALFAKMMVGSFQYYYSYPIKSFAHVKDENHPNDNITSSDYYNFFNYAFKDRQFEPKVRKSHDRAVLDPVTRTGEAYYHFICKNNDEISFTILVEDNLDIDRDTAVILDFTYHHQNGCQTTIVLSKRESS